MLEALEDYVKRQKSGCTTGWLQDRPRGKMKRPPTEAASIVYLAASPGSPSDREVRLDQRTIGPSFPSFPSIRERHFSREVPAALKASGESDRSHG